jgi:phosphatidate phosphatase APP1
MSESQDSNVVVKVFNGYGHQHGLVVYGQVKKGPRKKERTYTRFSILRNIFSILKLYFIRPIPLAKVRLQWNGQSIYATTNSDGFFKIEWISIESTPGGWTPVRVYLLDNDLIYGDGKVFVPHITQYGFISDVDDTVLVSHSTNTGKKLTTLLTTDPLKRKTFSDVVHFYQLLSLSHTYADVRNPFFYVSNSEWNLYDYLTDFFTENKLPEGIFMLSDFKRWTEIFRIGSAKHPGKGDRMRRILEIYPNQQFILLGDNSQRDPHIYMEIANEHPERIAAIYIRMIRDRRKESAIDTLSQIKNKKIPIGMFSNTAEAIEHAKSVGII